MCRVWKGQVRIMCSFLFGKKKRKAVFYPQPIKWRNHYHREDNWLMFMHLKSEQGQI